MTGELQTGRRADSAKDARTDLVPTAAAEAAVDAARPDLAAAVPEEARTVGRIHPVAAGVADPLSGRTVAGVAGPAPSDPASDPVAAPDAIGTGHSERTPTSEAAGVASLTRSAVAAEVLLGPAETTRCPSAKAVVSGPALGRAAAGAEGERWRGGEMARELIVLGGEAVGRETASRRTRWSSRSILGEGQTASTQSALPL